MSTAKIKMEKINKVFKTKRQTIVALSDIDIEVNENEFIAIVGPSGCGKSTIIRIINDIIKPTSGNIYIDGKQFGKKVPREVVRKMGFIFQQPNLLPWLTVRGNIELPLKIFGEYDNKSREQADKLIEMMGLKEYQNAYPSELSGGMTQRVGVLRAMIHSPEILLMDEPFGALDEKLREQMDIKLLEIWERLHQTIVFITHNIVEAVLLASTIYVMNTNPGRIVEKIDIDFPYPRDLDILIDPKFIVYINTIVSLIGELHLKEIK